MDGAAVFMQRMIGDGKRRAAADGVHRFAFHAIFTHRHQQAIMALRDGRGRAAFQHFAGIPGGGGRQLRADGSGGPRRGITRAARQNHLRAIIQSLNEGFRPHHGNNTAGTAQGFAGKRWLITERADAPRRQPAL